MTTTQLAKWTLTAVTVAALSACGGGGDGDDAPAQQPPARSAAEGLWSNQYGGVLITANGEFWALEYDSSVGWLLYQGQIETNGNSFSGTGSVYNGSVRVSGTVNGSFTNTTLTATLSAQGLGSGTVTLAKTAIYDQTPSLAAVAGTYRSNTGTTVTVTNTGAISGSHGSCTFQGSARPSDDGKNYFRFTLTYGPSCSLLVSGKQSSGVVVPVDGTRAFYGEKLNDGTVGLGGMLTKTS